MPMDLFTKAVTQYLELGPGEIDLTPIVGDPFIDKHLDINCWWHPPARWTYCPVRKLARLGEQSGVVTKKLRKRTPSRARRSRCGVRANGWPVAPSESQRWSSVMTKTMFGRRACAAAGRVGAQTAATRQHHAAATEMSFRLMWVSTGNEDRRAYGKAGVTRRAQRHGGHRENQFFSVCSVPPCPPC